MADHRHRLVQSALQALAPARQVRNVQPDRHLALASPNAQAGGIHALMARQRADLAGASGMRRLSALEKYRRRAPGTTSDLIAGGVASATDSGELVTAWIAA